MPHPPFPPIEPPPTAWALAQARLIPGEDLVAVGADLAPGTLLAAYRSALFPMGLGEHGSGPVGWWSPDPRGILLRGDLTVSRSLRRSCARFAVTVDGAFDEVVAGCADPDRDGRWITAEIASAYRGLHDLGWAHSVEVWSDAGALVGGLYGVGVGGLFAGESMFHRATDASKVALVALVERWFADGDHRRIIDVQWATDHLRGLGVRTMPRAEYVASLQAALAVPPHDLATAVGGADTPG